MPKLLIKRIPVTATAWTDLVIPSAGRSWWLRNDSSDTRIRSDASDANTEDLFKTTVQYVVPGQAQWAPNQKAASLRLVDGAPDGTVILTMIVIP